MYICRYIYWTSRRHFSAQHVHRCRFLTREREFFIDNLLVRIHLIIVIIRWIGLAPWEFELPFPGSLTSTFLGCLTKSLETQSLHPDL